MFEDRKVGKFYIQFEMIDNHPNVVKKIMGECIIVRAEALYAERRIEYTALSNHFREVAQGYKIPMYQLVFVTTDDVIECRFEREEGRLENTF